jgi:3',5'-cyclic AMP phosphodiesterase CpdA
MHVRQLTIPLLLAGLCLAGPATAGRGDPFQERLFDARQLLERGIANGRLVPHEVERLRRQQHDIVLARHRHLADGSLNRAEYRDLDRRLDNHERNLRALAHNQRGLSPRRYPDRHAPRYRNWTQREPAHYAAPPVFSYGPPGPGLSGYGYRYR